MVQKDGSISDVLLLRGAEPKLDKEAIRLVNAMPNWQPAIFKGERCVRKVQTPILFKN